MAALALYCFAGGVFMQATEAAEPAANAYEYFRLGEIVHSVKRYEYFRIIANGMKQRLDSHREFMQKLNLGQESLAAFDALAAVALSMPFPKEPSFSKWSSADQERWKKEAWDAQDKLGNAVKAEMAKNPQSEFFYWLGFQSMKLSWSVPMDINDNGYKVSEVKSTVKGGLEDFEWMRDHKMAENLTPDVAAVVKSLASMKGKIDDPLDEPTKKDIDKLAESAQSIRDAAKEKKLVR